MAVAADQPRATVSSLDFRPPLLHGEKLRALGVARARCAAQKRVVMGLDWNSLVRDTDLQSIASANAPAV
jgi:hypothetical protein